MIFNLPDFPNGKQVRIASDQYQWILQEYWPGTEASESKWISIGFYTDASKRGEKDGDIHGIRHAVEGYIARWMRLSDAEGWEEAQKAVRKLSEDLSKCLGHIGITIKFDTLDK